MLLRVQGITLSWLRALGNVMIGLFFNLFLQGRVGDDAVPLYFVFRAGLLGAALHLLSRNITSR
jgi:hypothetical protein